VTFEVTGEVWYWRGPAPFYFLTIPEEPSQQIREMISLITYGWGMVPVEVLIGATEFTTAMWPKDGLYALPLKAQVRRAEGIDEGDTITAEVRVVCDGQ
jgi:hypothetical protein